MITSTNPVVANALGINLEFKKRKISDLRQWREAKQKWDAAYNPLKSFQKYLWQQQEYDAAEPLQKAINEIHNLITRTGSWTVNEIQTYW